MMNVSTRIFGYIDDIQHNASELNSRVANARAGWDDVNYENIAKTTAARILDDAQTFCSTAKGYAQKIYNDILAMQSIINDL